MGSFLPWNQRFCIRLDELKCHTNSIEQNTVWSWYSYGTDVKSSLGYFHEYFIRKLFMKLSWIWYEGFMSISIETISWNSYEIDMESLFGYFQEYFIRKLFMKLSWIWYEGFMRHINWNVIMIFIWNWYEEFIWIFSGIFHKKIIHEIVMNLIWRFHETHR